MPRLASNFFSSRLALGTSIVALVLLALAPRPAAQLLAGLHQPATVLLTPVQRPARSIVAWLMDTDARKLKNAVSVDEYRSLQEQSEEYRQALLRTRQEVEDLRRLIRDLSATIQLNPSEVNFVVAPVIGFGADLTGGLLSVQAGTREGVNVNDVVVLRGVHLLGRVQTTRDRHCTVRPITHRTAGKIRGVIMLDDQKYGPVCQFEPLGDGTLSGMTTDIDAATGQSDPSAADLGELVQPGMTVRLIDPSWPQSSRMLIMGQVVSVEPSPTQIKRRRIVIRPQHNIISASEVMVRLPRYAAEGSTLPAPAPAPRVSPSAVAPPTSPTPVPTRRTP